MCIKCIHMYDLSPIGAPIVAPSAIPILAKVPPVRKVYLCTYLSLYLPIYLYIISLSLYIYIYIYIYMYVCICIYIYIYVYIMAVVGVPSQVCPGGGQFQHA